jgi:hypothetical protein
MARASGSPIAKPAKLARGHHAAMAYDDVAAFVGKLREREATAALAEETDFRQQHHRRQLSSSGP